MVGSTTTLWLQCFVSALMEQFLLLTWTFRVQHMIEQLQTGEIYTTNSSRFTTKMELNVALIPQFWTWNAPYIIKSSQKNLVGVRETTAAQKMDWMRKKQATSMWQSSEWGMRMIQSSFPWMCDKVQFEEKGEHRIAIKMMVLLFNLCVHMVGINQIRNFFMPWLEIDVEKYMS